MSPGTREGNGNGAGDGFDDFDDFIRDRGETTDDAASDGYRDHPRGGYDPYEDYARAQSGARPGANGPGFDRGLVDGITRILESLAGVAGDALAPGARRQLERALRDLLVVLRDVIDAMIARIDSRRDVDVGIEEIPID